MSLMRYGTTVPVFVKRLRDDMRWSQTDLAKQLGVHAQYVSNVERGVHKNPVAFCSLLFAVCPKERRDYLMDLIADSGSDRAVEKIRKAQRGGKWHERSKTGKTILRSSRR